MPFSSLYSEHLDRGISLYLCCMTSYLYRKLI
nr:MAG TPA: hypothetical protein [Bacteriophage sp.]